MNIITFIKRAFKGDEIEMLLKLLSRPMWSSITYNIKQQLFMPVKS